MPETASSQVRETVAALDERDGAEHRTRGAVLAHLLGGAMTAADLAKHLQLTTAGIRRHLDSLTAEGLVDCRDVAVRGSRGRGRPAKEFFLTASAREKLPHSYDDLAVAALEFLEESAGPEAVTAFARSRAQALVAAYQEELDAAPDAAARADILADALRNGGFVTSVRPVGVGEALCQHHCPVSQVAARFPQLCQAEFEVFGEALDTHIQRLATIATGDTCCTTYIPAAHVTVGKIRASPDTDENEGRTS